MEPESLTSVQRGGVGGVGGGVGGVGGVGGGVGGVGGVGGGVPELQGEPGPELALSVSVSAVSSVIMMQIL